MLEFSWHRLQMFIFRNIWKQYVYFSAEEYPRMQFKQNNFFVWWQEK
jgi:hypothetical protein